MTIFRGESLRFSIRGASHAPCIEFRLSGLPADFKVDERKLAAFMKRRAPGRDRLSTSRRESDVVHWIVSGLSGYLLNEDVRPGDYGEERTVPRPGHADWPQYVRYGRIPAGGGSNSGRMTAAFCAAGGMCLQFLESRGISISAKIVRCGDIAKAKKEDDSVGGVIECEVKGVPVGLGGAMFDGLDGEISKAIFGIPGVKGIEFGNGFSAADLHGSENNDAFDVKNGEVITKTNRHGGVLGGFSSGMPIVFRVAMKPTPTIFKEQDSVDLATLKPVKLSMKGRHDPCIVRRAVPVVEAMAAMVIADALIANDRQPRICLTLTGKTLEEDIAQYESQKFFTDMVELRVDLLEKEVERVGGGGQWSEKIGRFVKRVKVPVIVTDDAKTKHAVSILKEYGKDKVIRAAHDFTGAIPKVKAKKGEISKIAFMPRSLKEVGDVFTGSPRADIVIAMGPLGVVTRILASRLGSPWTYASADGSGAPGQLTPLELVRDYRFRSITRNTTLFGVTGWPLTKTRSPELHNAAFAREDVDAVMIPMPAQSAEEALGFMKTLEMRGLAVTIPHKETILPLLDEIDATAKAVGAVNTVLCDDEGKLRGCNTDVAGFTRAFIDFINDNGNWAVDSNIVRRVTHEAFQTEGLQVALLGAGGAAKACRYALKKLGCKVTVFHRKPLVGKFDVIVNATPVDPIPDYVFRGDELVFDLRYVPETTDLMSRAAGAGCKVCNGFAMLRHQAEEQRRIWLKG